MHSVMGVMTALVVSAAGTGDEANVSATAPEVNQRRTFVGLAVPLVNEGFALEAERELDERFSLDVGLRVGFNGGDLRGLFGETGSSTAQVGVDPGLRFYLTGKALKGMWLGPRLEMGYAWHDSTNEGNAGRLLSSQRYWELGGAMLAGYSVRLSEGFSVQAALGVGVTHLRGTHSGTLQSIEGGEPQFHEEHSRRWNVGHRAQLAVGWVF
jgi:Protein of unknown function (DUF3575)